MCASHCMDTCVHPTFTDGLLVSMSPYSPQHLPLCTQSLVLFLGFTLHCLHFSVKLDSGFQSTHR